ncbi:hypothetical protein EFP84_18950 [Leptospira kmetyi]|uniref:CN hydrolase domain-containing protein n=1 Tax=Leptospira kmetyi TaxID=408139 RepID=A0AAD0XSE2_9LEPT|nr:nitrilase-related carbon-nitrogen hydrolase [Leptospira kmetyi]AYV57716.1 hypothetical protein EFP84_18950 [Leptospira kmetyi]
MKTKFVELRITNHLKPDKLKFAIVNQKVNISDSLNNALSGNNHFLGIKKKELNILLNSAIREKCNLIIFPENSIPWQWENYLKDCSYRNNIGIIVGYQHKRNIKGEIVNEIGVFLPRVNKLGRPYSIFVDKRIKIHYSPLEIDTIISRRFSIPEKSKKESMRIYKWRGVYFSVFNCYELADLNLRTKLVGKIDLLIAVEYNKDTSYFSSVIESASRDIHCYIIQVNTSEFGDSRIVAPKKSDSKDILKLKGGENPVILTSTLEFTSLRRFQSMKPFMQSREQDKFKITPPNYNISAGRIDTSINVSE